VKLLYLSFPFQHTEAVESILRRHPLGNYVVYARVAGRNEEGRHDGSQAFPGSLAVIQAQLMEEDLEGLLKDLRAFREEKKKNRFLQALTIPVEQLF
jgi:hypothetical protein